MERLDKRLFSFVYICTAYHSKPDDRVVDMYHRSWSNSDHPIGRVHRLDCTFVSRFYTAVTVSKLWIFLKEQQRCRNSQKRLEFVNYIPNKTLKQQCHILWKLRNNTSVLSNIWWPYWNHYFGTVLFNEDS